MIMSGFFVGMSIGSLLGPRMIERVGHTRAFAALASVASAAALIHLLFVDPWAWIAIRTLTGFCFAGLIIACESWLNASVASESRGQLLSIYAMAGLGAGAAGQFLLSLADPAGYKLFVIVSIILSLVPVALNRAQAPMPQSAQAPPSIRLLWAISPFGCVAALLGGATLGSFFHLAVERGAGDLQTTRRFTRSDSQPSGY